MSNPFGFAVRSKDDIPVFLPLKSVDVSVEIVDVSAQVELTQVYSNDVQAKNAAARYIFPVPVNAAVCSFRMETMDGRVVRSIVKEVSKAHREYEEAVREGKWAGLLEQISGDVFVVSVGAIPAGQNIRVLITYIEELPQDELVNQVRFTLPTYIAQRYGVAPTGIGSPSSDATNLKLDIKAKVQMASPILMIHSPSHRVVQESTPQGTGSSPTVYNSSVALDSSATTTMLDKDFVLTIQAANLNKPRCLAEIDPQRKSVAVSLTLVPQFGVPLIDAQEYVFVVDRSGSMSSCSRIDFAKNALQVLLKSIPTEGTLFNIASFGSSFTLLWNQSQEYTATSLRIAIEHVCAMSADMGGTEIEEVLGTVVRNRSSTVPTAVFVLTDGEVWNTRSLFNSISDCVAKAGDASLNKYIRVFTLGIGHGASTNLCQGLARVGNGICYMVSHSADIPSRCASLLNAARVPPIGNLWGLKVDWGHKGVPASSVTQIVPPIPRQIDPETFSFFMEMEKKETTTDDAGFSSSLQTKTRFIKQAPAMVPDIYPFNRFLVSAILCETTGMPRVVTLRGKVPGGGDIAMDFPVIQSSMASGLLHKLAARRLISDLEDGNISSLYVEDQEVGRPLSSDELVRLEVVRLSEEYQLASKFAAFVAVEERVVARTNHVDGRTYVGERELGGFNSLFSRAAGEAEDSAALAHDEEGGVFGDFGVRGFEAVPLRIRMFQAAKRMHFHLPQQDFQRHLAYNRLTGCSDELVSNMVSREDLLGDDVDYGISSSSRCPVPARVWEDVSFNNAFEGFHYDSDSQNASALADLDDNISTQPIVEVQGILSQDETLHNFFDSLLTRSQETYRPVLDDDDIGEPSAAHRTLSPLKIASLQDFDGSFVLDVVLFVLIAPDQRLRADETPAELASIVNAERVWATLLVAALMNKRMSACKVEWVGIWEKAKDFVLRTIGGDVVLFAQLLETATDIV